MATLILVLVTLFAALPVYRRVAGASPNGQGSIAMLEKLFPEWTGKLFVLCLLGFATTDFIITMTLSAADAAAHFTQNPFTPDWMKSQMTVTLVLLAILGAIFLKGFKEAIGVAVVLVGVYLALNLVVTGEALYQVMRHPESIPRWRDALFTQHSSPLAVFGISLLLFPKLALGLSGFETGVAVMPLIKGSDLAARVRNTRKLLSTAAVIMSIFLLATSFATTLLIEPEKFREGGEANGRALAYLAHRYLGNAFGTAYDISTILILAFAGASAMAGLLNLIPRYLPRFGMAPEWAKGARPLVLVFMGIATVVTILFHANVDAQGGGLCDRCPGINYVSRCRRYYLRLEAPAGRPLAVRSHYRRLCVYHRAERLRAARGLKNLFRVYSRHCRGVHRLSRAPVDGTAHYRGTAG